MVYDTKCRRCKIVENFINDVFIIKKDGTLEAFDSSKIIAAITKSANRVMFSFTDEQYENVVKWIETHIEKDSE